MLAGFLHRRWLFAAAATIVLAGAGVYVLSSSARRPPRGVDRERTIAPVFRITDVTGMPLDLATFRGKVVLLDFWATWCGPCRDEVADLNALQHDYGPRGLQVIGLSFDDEVAVVRSFMRDQHVSYPVALADSALGQRYGGVLSLPVKFIIDRDGRIAFRHADVIDARELAAEIRSLLAE